MFEGVASPQAALEAFCLDNVQHVQSYRSILDPSLRHDAESSQPLDWLRLPMKPQSFFSLSLDASHHILDTAPGCLSRRSATVSSVTH